MRSNTATADPVNDIEAALDTLGHLVNEHHQKRKAIMELEFPARPAKSILTAQKAHLQLIEGKIQPLINEVLSYESLLPFLPPRSQSQLKMAKQLSVYFAENQRLLKLSIAKTQKKAGMGWGDGDFDGLLLYTLVMTKQMAEYDEVMERARKVLQDTSGWDNFRDSQLALDRMQNDLVRYLQDLKKCIQEMPARKTFFRRQAYWVMHCSFAAEKLKINLKIKQFPFANMLYDDKYYLTHAIQLDYLPVVRGLLTRDYAKKPNYKELLDWACEMAVKFDRKVILQMTLKLGGDLGKAQKVALAGGKDDPKILLAPKPKVRVLTSIFGRGARGEAPVSPVERSKTNEDSKEYASGFRV